MTKTLSLELIEKLPKTDLHVHLDGSLRLSTILELADKEKIVLPASDEDGLRKAMNLGRNCGSLVEYLKAFDVTLRVMQTADALTVSHAGRPMGLAEVRAAIGPIKDLVIVAGWVRRIYELCT